MPNLNDFYYFVQIVDRGGITPASRALGIPKSTLSYRLSQLEQNLGVKLVNRTTRQIKVSEAGKNFYQHVILMLREAEAAEVAARQYLAEPSGVLRFTSSVAVAQFIMKDIVHEFIRAYPKIDVVHHVTDDFVDIVSEGIDVAIRAHSGPLQNSTLIQRKLAPAPWCLFASKSYLDEFGDPATPESLKDHTTLFMMRKETHPELTLRHPRKKETVVSLSPKLVSGDMAGLKEAARVGLGIVSLPAYVCRQDVCSGELVQVLKDWTADDTTLSALIPYRQGILPSVRVFLDYIGERFPAAVSTD